MTLPMFLSRADSQDIHGWVGVPLASVSLSQPLGQDFSSWLMLKKRPSCKFVLFAFPQPGQMLWMPCAVPRTRSFSSQGGSLLPKLLLGCSKGSFLSCSVPQKGRKFPGHEASSGKWNRIVWKTCFTPHFCPEGSKFYCIFFKSS